MASDQSLCQLQLNIPANLGFLALVSEGLRVVLEQAAGVPEKETLLYNVQLAAQEACTNIVNHAYGDRLPPGMVTSEGRIAIEINLTPDRLTVQLEDTGAAFALPAPGSIELPAEPQEHGYGLFLMYALVDEVIYQPLQGKNRWMLIKRLVGRGEPAVSN